MATCYKCGDEIDFRFIDGYCIPIHQSGGCSGYRSQATATQETRDSTWIGTQAGAMYESYVNANAQCPVCHDPVYFYQSPYGGRVFFDALGPPWPKHGCTDTSQRRSVIRRNNEVYDTTDYYAWRYLWQKDGLLDQDAYRGMRVIATKVEVILPKAAWQKAGWQPLIFRWTERVAGADLIKIVGKDAATGDDRAFYIRRQADQLHDRPFFYRDVSRNAGRFELSTIMPSTADGYAEPVYFVAYQEKSRFNHHGWYGHPDYELIQWFLTAVHLPSIPFGITSRLTVTRPSMWYAALHQAITDGPRCTWARTGKLRRYLIILQAVLSVLDRRRAIVEPPLET